MVHENKSIRNRILVEDVPSALQHLTDILEAMRENRVLEIEYHPFYLEESQHIQLLPLYQISVSRVSSIDENGYKTRPLHQRLHECSLSV